MRPSDPRPSGGMTAAQVAGEFLAQRTRGLHEQRQVDRLVRHAHLRVVGERLTAATRRSAAVTTAARVLASTTARSRSQVASFDGFGRRARASASTSARQARYRRRPPLLLTSRVTVEGARPSRAAIARSDSPPATPTRDLLTLGQRQPQRRPPPSRHRRLAQLHDPGPHRPMTPPDLLRDQPPRQPSRRQLRDPRPLLIRQPRPRSHHNLPRRPNPSSTGVALTP